MLSICILKSADESKILLSCKDYQELRKNGMVSTIRIDLDRVIFA